MDEPEQVLADTIQQITANESPESVLWVISEIQSYAGALALPKKKVQKQRAKYFKGDHFSTVKEVLDEAEAQRDGIV